MKRCESWGNKLTEGAPRDLWIADPRGQGWGVRVLKGEEMQLVLTSHKRSWNCALALEGSSEKWGLKHTTFVWGKTRVVSRKRGNRKLHRGHEVCMQH